MRKLLLGCLLWASVAQSATITPLNYVTLIFKGVEFSASESVPEELSITTQGIGDTQSIAIETALNLAIQKAVGVLMLSEQSVNNDTIVRNLVSQYSSGVVNSYKIDTCEKDKFYTCTVTAKVSPWKFMRKLEGDSQTIRVNGDDLFAKHQTAQNVLIQRYKMTQYYMSQIRQSGLDVVIRSVEMIPTSGSMAQITIEYEVKWNKEFKKEITRFLQKLEKDTVRNNSHHQVYIQWGPTGLFENRVRINTYDENFRRMMMRYIHEPTFIQINELGICENIQSDNVFTIDWYGVKRQKTFLIEPSKLKNMRSLNARLGCGKV